MAKIPGSVPVGGLLAPTDDSDTYAVTEDTYARGGFRPVADLTARDAIPAPRRKEGMLVRVNSDGSLWALGTDLTTWSPAAFGAAPSTVIAAEAISGHTVLTLDANGQAVAADASVAAHCLAFALSTGAAAIGAPVMYQERGVLEHPGWSFTSGAPVVLGNLGQLTQSPPVDAVFVKAMGLAVSPTRVSISPQPAIFR